MNLLKINIFHCDTPFIFSFHSPHTVRLQADSIIVELQFDNGISGYGESAPRPYVTDETPTIVADTIEHLFSKILFQSTIKSLEDVPKTLDMLEKKCLDENIVTYNSALGAVDIALLDGMARFERKTVHSYLGPIVNEKMSNSLPIPLLPESIISELHNSLKQLEFDSLKVIMGHSEKDNIERLRFIRSLFGDEIGIRIEANGKWQTEQAVSQIQKLKVFDISGVEQPVAARDIDGLKEVREKTGIPVIVDESMCNLSDAKKLIEERACDVINIKISKCGGLLRSKEIRDFAESKKIPCQIGAHVGETEILGRAGLHFAMTTRNLFCFEGFSYLLFDDSWGDRFLKEDDIKKALSNPGLGVDLTKQRLKLICSLENK